LKAATAGVRAKKCLLWCDEQPGHYGACSREIGSRMVHRQNGDKIPLSIRIRMDHHDRQVVEVQLGDELVHLDAKGRDWLQSQLRNTERHTRD